MRCPSQQAWSWLTPPQHWHLGDEAGRPVRACAFDVSAVRELRGKAPALDRALYAYVAGLIADRPRADSRPLLDLYAPYSAGQVP